MSSPVMWNLSVFARDADRRVVWPSDRSGHTLPPLIMFAYFTHSDRLPRTWWPPWGKWQVARYTALRYIFRTGNWPPSLPFDTSPASLRQEPDASPGASPTSLARWRAEKEFRACVWLDEIRLWRDHDQTGFGMRGMYEVGYTPPPVRVLTSRPALPNAKRGYTQGKGAVWPTRPRVSFESWGARVQVEVGFRIDETLPKLGSYLLWARGVPYMRMTLDLEVRSAGFHRVAYNGSDIPTQVYQTDSATHTYDMVTDIGGYPAVRSALRAGFNAPAPARAVPVEKDIP